MIFNMSSAGGVSGPILPIFDGTYNFVSSPDGKSGYIELMSSGTLTWASGNKPKKVDVFCIGAGAGGSPAASATVDQYYLWRFGGGGGASGYTNTVREVSLPDSTAIEIGAGGTTGIAGGTTSVGNVCVAAGGNPATYPTSGKYTFARCVGGTGGSAGGNGAASRDMYASGANGGDGGTNGGVSMGGGSSVVSEKGKGQGTPTTDILGRIHGGGGAGGPAPLLDASNQIVHGAAGAGGESDFINGKGGNAEIPYYKGSSFGGGGYGGGGAGQCGNGGTIGEGGPGFAMIAWGDYLDMYNNPIELAYIESSGTQRIDTGLSMPNGFVAKMKVCMTATSANAQSVIGAIDDSSPYNRNYFTALQNLTRWTLGAYDDLACGEAISVGRDYEIEISTVHGNVYCKIDGVTQSIGTPSAASRSAKNIYLFDVNYPYSMPANMRMYYCQIFDSAGALVRDYVPAKRMRDSAVGMLDKVTGVLYPSVGSGEFIAGGMG